MYRNLDGNRENFLEGAERGEWGVIHVIKQKIENKYDYFQSLNKAKDQFLLKRLLTLVPYVSL